MREICTFGRLVREPDGWYIIGPNVGVYNFHIKISKLKPNIKNVRVTIKVKK